MAYKHGVYASEVPTAVTPPVSVGSVPVVFGTAPVNLSKRQAAPVNEPVLCHTYSEAVEAFGYSDDWRFSLCEFIHSHFALYAMAPVVLINVLDPAQHKTSVSDESVTVENGLATVPAQGVLKTSVVVKSDDGQTTYTLGADYELDYDDAGQLVVQRLASGLIPAGAALKVSYDKLDPDAVTANDIIGGIDGNGRPTGLELIDQVFPRFRLVPGLILAPGYSHEPAVAAVMTAKAGAINGLFKATALTDLPADEAYTDLAAWKEANGYTSPRQINGYPKVKLGDRTYHLSTQLAGVICATDAAYDSLPYVSPSNQPLKADSAVLEDGTPLFLGPDQAAFLNGSGIVTALNFVGGWKAWGNRTGAYPANTDPKDSFIPVRRMLDWISNTVILSYWQRLDGPITRRLTEAVTDSINLWLNGLVATGALLGGRVEFRADENPDTDLMDGIVRFHLYVTPPSPAREIDFIVEYDTSYLSSLTA
jgi:hypothetical protein